MVRIPQITNVETAVRIYYAKPLLGNADIIALFGRHSSATIGKLKAAARERMEERSIPQYNASTVNTDAAYEAWGLDIKDLERRYTRLKKYGLGD